MAKKQSKHLKRAKKNMQDLLDKKEELLGKLADIDDEFKKMGKMKLDFETWVNSPSINSLHDLHSKKPQRLQDLKIRCDLHKKTDNIIEELEKIDLEIRCSKIELLQAKIESSLESK